MRLSYFFSGLLTTVIAAAAPVDFVREVRPIFEQHCYGST
jgi:hypothetical protein